MNNMQNTPNEAPGGSSPEKFKAVFYPLLAIAGGIVVFLLLAKINPVQNTLFHRGNEAVQTGPSISAEERQSLEAQVKEVEAQIKNLPENAGVADRFKLYRKLAGAKYRLGEHKEALAALDVVAPENQGNASLWSLYTIIYQDMGDFAKARETARRAVDLDKDNPNNWLIYIVLSNTQPREELNKIYQEAVSSTDAPLEVVVAYAKFLSGNGDKPGAIAQWQRAAQLNPAGKASYDAEIAKLQ